MAQFFRYITKGKYAIMIIESFNRMNDHQKVQLIFEADKITERVDAEANYQLFKISNFFVEVKSSLEGKFKRSFTAYTLKDLPVSYVGEVLSIPIVTLNTDTKRNEFQLTGTTRKRSLY
jgi:hypothetical protein